MSLTATGYDTLDEQEIYNTLATLFRERAKTDAPIRDYAAVSQEQSTPTLLEASLLAQAATLATTQEEALAEVSESGFIQTATGEALTRLAEELGLSRRPPVAATGVVEFSRDSAANQDYVIPSGTVVQTAGTDPIRFTTVTTATISSGSTSAQATIKATEPGDEGNVGPGAITVMPSPPAGVQNVTNPDATGDPSVTDTRGDPLVSGRDRESDSSLRERALQRTDFGDTATAGAVRTSLSNIDALDSYAVNHNPESTATADGLDPYHTEVIAYGGAAKEIVLSLRDVMSVGDFLRLQSVHGTADSYTTTIDLLEDSYDIPISRPTVSNVDVDVTVSTQSEWAGTAAVKREIVEYLGGTDADGEFVPGLGVAADAYIGELRNRITDLDGVVALTNIVVDDNGDGTTNTTADANGVEYYDVGAAEVVETNVSDGSVTVTRNAI